MDELKSHLKQLQVQKDAVEAEVEALSQSLDAGPAGRQGNLLDAQGFPRADIDIPAIRSQRQRLAMLLNDHKHIMKQLDEGLVNLHQQLRSTHGPASATPAPPTLSHGTHSLATAAQEQHPQQQQNGPIVSEVVPASINGGAEEMQLDPPSLLAFARVHEVCEASPASEASIQVGDSLVRFGTVQSQAGVSHNELLQQVAQVLQAHEGREVEAVLLRRGVPVTVHLRPHVWSGRGLLGCLLRPL